MELSLPQTTPAVNPKTKRGSIPQRTTHVFVPLSFHFIVEPSLKFFSFFEAFCFFQRLFSTGAGSISQEVQPSPRQLLFLEPSSLRRVSHCSDKGEK
jgi:hypothetical protein